MNWFYYSTAYSMKPVLFCFCALMVVASCGTGDRSLKILAIGDSHGQAENGWVNQLRKLRPEDSIFNLAISGATTGFKNLGRDTLNTLKNIDGYLARGEARLKKIDYIIVALGTNDHKAVFDSLQDHVRGNLEKLILRIKEYPYKKSPPKVILVTPPPIAPDSLLAEKYTGASERLKKALPYYKQFSDKYDLIYVDVWTALLPDFPSLHVDGIHLTEEGYRMAAELINAHIE